MKPSTPLLYLLPALLLLPACGASDDADLPSSQPADAAVQVEAAEVVAMRAVADRYLDVNVALADGYMPDPTNMCITAEMEGQPAELGAMGIHYFRPDLLGITAVEPRVSGVGTHTDFSQPGVLIYEPQADGSLALVALENIVFEDAWHAAGNAAPPSFMGHEYVRMVNDPATNVDEAHGFDNHYELHAWIPRDNPAGMFVPFNTAVTCQHHVHSGS